MKIQYKFNVGTAEKDITPAVGIELTGFALRAQPSTKVLDRLRLRALYLQAQDERLLWLHVDVLALEQTWADRLRDRLAIRTGLPASHIWISAAHTHSGPPTIHLNCCGQIDAEYLAALEKQCMEAADSALTNVEPCRLVKAEAECHLGQDRTKTASPHTDPRVGVLGWQGADGNYKALLVNYAMHPVCMNGTAISADWPGATANVLRKKLPGHPTVLVCSGACGNINPPAVGVTFSQMNRWGEQIAEKVMEVFSRAEPNGCSLDGGAFRVRTEVLDLPLETWTSMEIDRYAQACLADEAGRREFGAKFNDAIASWRSTMLRQVNNGKAPKGRAILGLLSLGHTVIVTLNAEVYSQFSRIIGGGRQCTVYPVGCTNGMVGYLPAADAYEDGGYEVEWSLFFYNLPRPQRGALELLAEQARRLIASNNGSANTVLVDSPPSTESLIDGTSGSPQLEIQ